jgi:hypothetical protein
MHLSFDLMWRELAWLVLRIASLRLYTCVDKMGSQTRQRKKKLLGTYMLTGRGMSRNKESIRALPSSSVMHILIPEISLISHYAFMVIDDIIEISTGSEYICTRYDRSCCPRAITGHIIVHGCRLCARILRRANRGRIWSLDLVLCDWYMMYVGRTNYSAHVDHRDTDLIFLNLLLARSSF